VAGDERGQAAALLGREHAAHLRGDRGEQVHRGAPRRAIAAVRRVGVVRVGERGQVARQRRPDRVEAHGVAAVERGDAVGLRAAQAQRVGLAQELGERVGEPAVGVHGAEQQLGRLLARRAGGRGRAAG
jgi:hypothetical protein